MVSALTSSASQSSAGCRGRAAPRNSGCGAGERPVHTSLPIHQGVNEMKRFLVKTLLALATATLALAPLVAGQAPAPTPPPATPAPAAPAPAPKKEIKDPAEYNSYVA